MRHKWQWAALLLLLCCIFAFAACSGPAENEETENGGNAPKVEFTFTTNSRGAVLTGVKADDKDAVTELTIPAEYEGQKVYSIADQALQSFHNMVTLNLPDGLQFIGIRSFENSYSLRELTLPDTVESIGGDAFTNCTGLVRVTLGQSLTSIGAEAFAESNKLLEVYNRSNLTLTAGDRENGYVAYYAKNIYTDPAESNLKTEGDFVFYDDGDARSLVAYAGSGADVTLPDGSYDVYDGALRYNSIVTDVTIPDSVTAIGKEAFADCAALNTVKFGKGTALDGKYLLAYTGTSSAPALPEYYNGSSYHIIACAFYYDQSLQTLAIPRGVWSIGDSAFRGCGALSSLTFEMDEYALIYVGDNAFTDCTALQTLHLPGVAYGDNVFTGCTGLQTIVLEKINSATNLGSQAFGFDLTFAFYYNDTKENADPDIEEKVCAPHTKVTFYYYSETAPSGEGNYWHYAGDVPAAW